MKMHPHTCLPERNLDVLRAIAVLAVLGCHVGILTHVASGAWWLALGRGGVLLFFVHTACVLMASLERGGTGRGWVTRFYVRRACRIYPLAAVLVVMVTALALPNQLPQVGAVIPYHPLSTQTLVANVALSQNLIGAPNASPVLWSLPVEVQMYILLPILFLAVTRTTRRSVLVRILALLAWAAIVGLAVQLGGSDGEGSALAMLTFAPVFSMGIIVYMLARSHGTATHHLPARMFPFLLVGLLAAFATTYLSPSRIPERGWLVGLLVGLIVITSRELRDSWLTRSAKRVAEYSYGIYLFHVPALWAVVAFHNASMVVRSAVTLFLLVALPIAGYHLIERPGIALGKRLTGRRNTLARQFDSATAPAP